MPKVSQLGSSGVRIRTQDSRSLQVAALFTAQWETHSCKRRAITQGCSGWDFRDHQGKQLSGVIREGSLHSQER